MTGPAIRRSAVAALAATLQLAVPVEGQFKLGGAYDLTSFFGEGTEGQTTPSSLGLGPSAALFSLGPVVLVGEGYYRQKGAKNVAEFNERVFEEGSAEIGLDTAILGGTGAINVDARLTQGLSRINELADGGSEVKNRAFSLMLGYSFGIPGGLAVPGA